MILLNISRNKCTSLYTSYAHARSLQFLHKDQPPKQQGERQIQTI